MSRAARSKFATDIMYRLYDETRGSWVVYQNKTIWPTRATPVKIRERLIEEGRSPETLSVERVLVEVK